MHDKQLIRRTCTQHNDHGVVTVWPPKVKIKTGICTHTVSKLGSPVSSKVLLVLSYFLYPKNTLDTCCNTSEIYTYYTGMIRIPQRNIIKTKAVANLWRYDLLIAILPVRCYLNRCCYWWWRWWRWWCLLPRLVLFSAAFRVNCACSSLSRTRTSVQAA